MSTNDETTSLPQAEKLFCDKVIERYLLTIKSGGIGDLLLLLAEQDHDYQMWSAYNDHDGGLGWIAKCDSARLCRAVVGNLTDILRLSVGQLTFDLHELGNDSDTGVPAAIRIANGKTFALRNFQPAPSYTFTDLGRLREDVHYSAVLTAGGGLIPEPSGAFQGCTCQLCDARRDSITRAI